MINDMVRKCFKINSVEEMNAVETIVGDVIYIRSHPFVYLHSDSNDWKRFTKIYANESHPKYNMEELRNLKEPYMFKIENMEDLNSVPAKYGDLIYRNGDSFMYLKSDMNGITTYTKILKI